MRVTLVDGLLVPVIGGLVGRKVHGVRSIFALFISGSVCFCTSHTARLAASLGSNAEAVSVREIGGGQHGHRASVVVVEVTSGVPVESTGAGTAPIAGDELLRADHLPELTTRLYTHAV